MSTTKKGAKAREKYCGHIFFVENWNGNSRISSFIQSAEHLTDFSKIVKARFEGASLNTVKKLHGFSMWAASSTQPNLWMKIHSKDEPCPEGWLKDVHVLKLNDFDEEVQHGH